MHNAILKTFLSLIAALVMFGCATQVDPGTGSGRPEVLIKGTTASKVQGVLTNEVINMGYAPRSRSDVRAVFDRRQDFRITKRMAFELIEIDGSVRVIGTLHDIVNIGTREEYTVSVHNNVDERKPLMDVLAKAKASLEKT